MVLRNNAITEHHCHGSTSLSPSSLSGVRTQNKNNNVNRHAHTQFLRTQSPRRKQTRRHPPPQPSEGGVAYARRGIHHCHGSTSLSPSSLSGVRTQNKNNNVNRHAHTQFLRTQSPRRKQTRRHPPPQPSEGGVAYARRGIHRYFGPGTTPSETAGIVLPVGVSTHRVLQCRTERSVWFGIAPGTLDGRGRSSARVW